MNVTGCKKVISDYINFDCECVYVARIGPMVICCVHLPFLMLDIAKQGSQGLLITCVSGHLQQLPPPHQ